MRVTCVSSIAASLPLAYFDPPGGVTPSSQFDVTVGDAYVVYALITRRNTIWYYLIDETGVGYPIWHPAPLFNLTDARVSRFWVCRRFDSAEGEHLLMAIAPWAADPAGFYEQLSDGDPNVVKSFNAYQSLIDFEALQEDDLVAQWVSRGVLFCPNCRTAWRASILGDSTSCPGCARRLQLANSH